MIRRPLRNVTALTYSVYRTGLRSLIGPGSVRPIARTAKAVGIVPSVGFSGVMVRLQKTEIEFMFDRTGGAPGDHEFVLGATEQPWTKPPRAIGKIHTIVGSFTVARAGAALVQLKVGDLVYEGDVVETGADSAVGIVFNDGTVFHLSARTRMVLSQFACDGASSNSAQFGLSRGAIAFTAGGVGKGGGLWIDTPVARIRGSRGGGIASLTLAALTFAALEEVRANDHPVIDDDQLELPHGTFELLTKEKDPRVIVVDDPWQTIVLRKVASTVEVEKVANSAERMDELGAASRDTFALYRLGQQDPFIRHQQRAELGSSEHQQHAELGGSETGSDGFSVTPVSLANFVTPDFNPVSVLPATAAAFRISSCSFSSRAVHPCRER